MNSVPSPQNRLDDARSRTLCKLEYSLATALKGEEKGVRISAHVEHSVAVLMSDREGVSHLVACLDGLDVSSHLSSRPTLEDVRACGRDPGAWGRGRGSGELLARLG